VRQAISAVIRAGHKIVLVFVDISKAFDTVSRKRMEEVLSLHGFGPTERSLLQRLWSDEVCRRFPDRSHGAPLKTKRDTKQGCVTSPALFGRGSYGCIALRNCIKELDGTELINACSMQWKRGP